VHGEQVRRAGALGDACRPAQDGLAFLVAGQGDDNAFAGLPVSLTLFAVR
jgi:hypothetical protein